MGEGTVSFSCTCRLISAGYHYAFVGPCVHDLLTDALARIAELERVGNEMADVILSWVAGDHPDDKPREAWIALTTQKRIHGNGEKAK